MSRTTEDTIRLACLCMSGTDAPGRVWCVINAQTGEMLTWSVSKAAASKGQRRLGTPWILAKLEPAR